MIDCSKPINYPTVINTSVTYIDPNKGYQRVQKTIDVPRDITQINHRFGYVQTDVKETDWNSKIQANGRMYDVVDLETGYVLARVFKRQIKEAVKMFEEFKHTGDGVYKAITWNAEINSKRRYTQDESH